MNEITDKVKHDLAYLLNRAYEKHGPMTSDMATLGVVTEEYFEVVEAMRGKERWRVRAELLDLAIGAIRGVLAIDAEAEARKEGAA